MAATLTALPPATLMMALALALASSAVVAKTNVDHECYLAVNASATVTDIGFVAPNRWGSQPSTMLDRPGGPTAAALAEAEKVAGGALMYHGVGMLPAVYVQALTTPQATADDPAPAAVALDPKIATVAQTAEYTVAFRYESADDPPLPSQPWSFASFGIDAVAVVRVDGRTGPVAGTWQVAMYLWWNNTIATGSSRLATVPLNVTRDASLPTQLSFASRFTSGDLDMAGSALDDMWQQATGTRGLVEDEREASVAFEGATICATMNLPVPAFAVHVDFSDGRQVYATTDLAVKLSYFDTVQRRLSTAALINHTVALNSRGHAVFSGLAATTNVGAVEVIASVIYAPTGATLRVPPIAFRLAVERALNPECAVTFLKRRSPEAYYLPEPTAATASPRVTQHRSPLEVVAGQRLPAVSVAIVDSSGGLNGQANNGVIVVEATGGASVLSGDQVPLVHGIAVFEDIVLDPATAVPGALVQLSFRVSTLRSRGAQNVLPTSTLPMRVLDVAPPGAGFFVRAVPFIEFLPTSVFMPFEGASRTVRSEDPLPTISLVAGDSLGAEYTRAVTGLSAHVECVATPDVNATVAGCTLGGTLTQAFKADGTVDFDDLVFPTPLSVVAVRLQFHITDSTTNPRRTAAVNKYRISTGPIRVLPRFDTPLVTGADFYRDSHAIFWEELDRSPTLIGRRASLPPIIVRLTGYDGSEVIAENEISVEARAAAGDCVVHGGLVYAHRGLAQFRHLAVSGCNTGVTVFRLAFVVGREGRYNRAAGHTILTAPLHLTHSDVIPGVLRVDSPNVPFLRHAESAVSPAGGNIPNIRVGVYASSFGESIRVAATAVQGKATVSHGIGNWVTFSGPTEVDLVAGTAELRGLRPQIPVGDVASITMQVCITGLAVPCFRRRLVLLASARLAGFVTDAPIPLPVGVPDEIESTASNISFTAGFGTYEVSTGNFLLVDVTPTSPAAGVDTSVRLIASQDLRLHRTPDDNPPSVSINGSALATMTELNFADEAVVLRDSILTMRLETAFVPVASESRAAATMYPPLAIVERPGASPEGLAITVDVIKPIRLFHAERWVRAVAKEFQVSPQQLRIERIAEAALTTNPRARTTRVEMRVVPGRPQDPLNRDVRLVVEQLLAFRDSCALTADLDIKSARITGTPAPSATGCDAESLREWTEAARHCEAFLGRDERCNCFTNVFGTMGSACRTDPQMPGLCVYLQACSSGTINDVCDEVVPSQLLRIALVVGGTMLSLLFITVVVKLNTSNTPLRRTETLKAQGNPAFAKSRLAAEEEHFNEVFI